MKKLIALTVISLLVCALSATCYAANSRKGKKIYNKICRSCHIRGGEGSRMAPSDKTIEQWQHFVEKIGT